MKDYKNIYRQGKRTRQRIEAICGVMAILAAFLITGYIENDVNEQEAKIQKEQSEILAKRSNQSNMEAYFRSNGSPFPEVMAKAVTQPTIKRPRTLAAIAIVESNGNPKAKGKSGEIGAFQILPIHGKAKNVFTQAEQADRLLQELLDERGSLPAAIKGYNGTGKKADVYRRKVLAQLERVPDRGE
jgi:negative regulator of sigma E activity